MLLLLMILSSAACDKNPSAPVYQKEITVFGYLRGNENLSENNAILIAYTQPLTGFYKLDQAVIRGATVNITENGTGQIYALHDSPEKPGFYFNNQLFVKPKETYGLKIEYEGRTVTAATTVPPVLQITTQLSKDSVNYVHPTNLSRQKPIFLNCEKENQIILVDLFCNETFDHAEYISTFRKDHHYPENQEEYDGGTNSQPRHIQGIAQYKELVSPEYPGQHVIYWYSSMLVFYGSNTMQVIAIDDNYHHFLYKEHPEFESGVTGGIGVFGSVIGATFKLQVLKEQN